MDSTILEIYFNENERLLNTEDFYDVKICIGIEPNIKEVHAHSSIICAHCPFFQKALTIAKKVNGYYIIENANLNELAFKTLLKFLYTCKIELDELNGADILQLLITADELGLESFYKFTMNYFIKKHEVYIKENSVKILRAIYTNEESFKEFKNIYLEKFCNYYSDDLFESSEFELLEKPVLLAILERNDFVVQEIVVWESILKWGLAKHPEINNINNVKVWTKQNFTDLGNTLKELIPLIRFQDISSEDFRYKIVPFKKLLPKDLWDTLLDYYLVSNKQQTLNLLPSRIITKLESLTINRKLTLLFASWINKEIRPYTSLREVKYVFKLLYRSSRDGIDTSILHQKCNDSNKILVVGKIQGSDQIVGGYNPSNRNLYSSINEVGSFIFNINNRNDINTGKISYFKDTNLRMVERHYKNLFLKFGYSDLLFNTNGTITRITSYYYDDINIVNDSKFDELEIFQVIDKD